MSTFKDSHVGQLRALVGDRMLLMPGARIVIENPDGRILLQLRSDFGVWGIPGGGPEPGDSMMDTIVREVFEETGLRIDTCQPYGFGSDPDTETITFPNGDKAQYFVLNYYTSTYSGSLLADNDETLKLDWFLPTDLPSMLPNMQRSVEAFLAFKRSGLFQSF